MGAQLQDRPMLPFTGFFAKIFLPFYQYVFLFKKLSYFAPPPTHHTVFYSKIFSLKAHWGMIFYWLKSFWLQLWTSSLTCSSRLGQKKGDRDYKSPPLQEIVIFVGTLTCAKSRAINWVFSWLLRSWSVPQQFILENFKFIRCTYMKIGMCSWSSTIGLKYQRQFHNLCRLQTNILQSGWP